MLGPHYLLVSSHATKPIILQTHRPKETWLPQQGDLKYNCFYYKVSIFVFLFFMFVLLCNFLNFCLYHILQPGSNPTLVCQKSAHGLEQPWGKTVMPTPAKPNQSYPFLGAPATSSCSFVPQIKPDASPEGKITRSFAFFPGCLGISQPLDRSPQAGKSIQQLHPCSAAAV